MNLTRFSNRIIAGVLIITLCGLLPVAQAWQQPTPPPAGGETQAVPAPTPAPSTPAPAAGTQPQTATPAPQQGNAPQTGTTVDPAQGPLEPTPGEAAPEGLPSAETPAAAGSEQQQPAQDETVTDQLPEKPQPQKPSEPVGAATAEKGRTAGGAASKPAGAAIAPAKQRQVRSFLIKLGAIAGVGIAAGTIYALTRGTPSTPPGAPR